MGRIGFCITCLIAMVSMARAQAPQMVPGWPYISRAELNSVSTTPRIVASGNPEIAAVYFNNITRDIHKFRLTGIDFPEWPLLTDTVVFNMTTPIIVDIDHDGLNEIVTMGIITPFGRPYRHSLLVINDDGTSMPGFPIIINDPKSLNVADFDNDNEYEIISFSKNDRLIYCFDHYGNSKPGWPVAAPYDLIGHTPYGSGGAVGDLDLDGTNEYILQGLFHLYAYRYDGTMAVNFPIAIHDTTYGYSNNWTWPVTLGDVDSDGYLEILTTADNGWESMPPQLNTIALIYEHTGELKSGWPLYFYNQMIRLAPIPADINGDGIVEIGIHAYDLQFVDLSGQPLPGWPVTLRNPEGGYQAPFSDLIIVDIDGDNDCEIFTDCNSIYPDSVVGDTLDYWGFSYFYGYDHLGQTLPGFPLVVGGDTFLRPPCFSYNESDNRLLMAIYTTMNPPSAPWIDSTYVELYVFPDSTGPTTEWPMLSHDYLMTRNYNFVDRVVSVYDGGEEILPKTPILRQNYPNPFNTSTLIEFSLPEEGHFTLSVYDILGRKVIDLYDDTFPAGSYKHRLDMDVPSGVYFYTLKTEKTRITRKMTLLK